MSKRLLLVLGLLFLGKLSCANPCEEALGKDFYASKLASENKIFSIDEALKLLTQASNGLVVDYQELVADKYLDIFPTLEPEGFKISTVKEKKAKKIIITWPQVEIKTAEEINYRLLSLYDALIYAKTLRIEEGLRRNVYGKSIKSAIIEIEALAVERIKLQEKLAPSLGPKQIYQLNTNIFSKLYGLLMPGKESVIYASLLKKKINKISNLKKEKAVMGFKKIMIIQTDALVALGMYLFSSLGIHSYQAAQFFSNTVDAHIENTYGASPSDMPQSHIELEWVNIELSQDLSDAEIVFIKSISGSEQE